MPVKKTPLPSDTETLNILVGKAVENFRLLEKELVQLKRSNPRPANLFYHQYYILGRIEDIRIIIFRFGNNRELAKKLNMLHHANIPKKEVPGKPLSAKLQKINNLYTEATKRLTLDMESVYIFGNLLLDQWAYCIGYISGQTNPSTFDFKKMMNLIQEETYMGILKELWQNHKTQMLWLFFQLKFYRNNFIEHIQRPLQKGSTMASFGDDFQLFIPTATQLFADDEIEKEINSIKHLAPKWLLDMPDDYWEKQRSRRLLERTVENIQNIEKKEDREKVWRVWIKIGGSSPTFYNLTNMLLQFMIDSQLTILNFVKKHPSKIDFDYRA